jgi:putative FmdB family regulatory protein
MPNYDFRCPDCGTTVEINVPLADRDNIQPCMVCLKSATASLTGGTGPRTRFMERVVSAPAISHVYGGYGKVPEGFKDVLRNIKKNNVGSLIDV